MRDPLEEWFYSVEPEKCKGCECSEINWDLVKAEPVWTCELKECYHGLGETTNDT